MRNAIFLLALPLAAQTMFRGGPTHSGAYPASGPRQFHQVKWKFATGDKVVSSPVIHNGVIFFGGDDANIYAVDAATGRQRWKFTTGGPAPSTPAVADGLVYAMSYDGRLYAINEQTGKLRWKFATAGEKRFEAKGIHGFQPATQTIADPFDTFLSSPVVAAGVVFVGAGDNHLYAVDAATGELKWKFATGDVVHSSPAYADATVYVGSWDSRVYAIDAVTGKEKWHFEGGQDPVVHNQVGFQSSPAVVNGVVYIGCRDSNLYAIDAATGKERWKFNNQGSWVIASPAVVGNKVLFATSDSSLFYALDAATGKQLYKQDTRAYVFSSPSIAGNTVYFGVLNGIFEARDLESGEKLWEYQVETSRRNGDWVLTADKRLNGAFTFTSGWRETALLGAERQFRIGGIFSSPLIDNGVVYFGSADGYLYAVE